MASARAGKPAGRTCRTSAGGDRPSRARRPRWCLPCVAAWSSAGHASSSTSARAPTRRTSGRPPFGSRSRVSTRRGRTCTPTATRRRTLARSSRSYGSSTRSTSCSWRSATPSALPRRCGSSLGLASSPMPSRSSSATSRTRATSVTTQRTSPSTRSARATISARASSPRGGTPWPAWWGEKGLLWRPRDGPRRRRDGGDRARADRKPCVARGFTEAMSADADAAEAAQTDDPG